MEYVWLQPERQQYCNSRMHVKVAILVLVLARDLISSGTVAVVARRVGSVVCPTKKIYPYFPVKIVNREKIQYLQSSTLLTDKIM